VHNPMMNDNVGSSSNRICCALVRHLFTLTFFTICCSTSSLLVLMLCVKMIDGIVLCHLKIVFSGASICRMCIDAARKLIFSILTSKCGRHEPSARCEMLYAQE
jgi:hypothetical protein